MEEEEDDILQLALFWAKKLLPYWKQIAVCAFAAAFVGGVLSFGIPKTYTSVSKMAPESAGKSGNGSLSSLASLAGINLGSMTSGGDAVLPTIYPEVASSIPFVVSLFDMPVRDTTNLYNYMLNDQKSSWAGAIMSLPGKAIGGVMSLFKDKEDEEEGVIDIYHLTGEQEGIYKALAKSIIVDVDKKTSVITITVVAQDPVVAADLNSYVRDKLREYVTEYRINKVQDNVDYLKGVYADAQKNYYEAQRTFAQYSDAHQAFSNQSARIESQRLQNDMNLKFELYSAVSQQLQQAELLVQQEAPVFFEVVPPTVPLKKTKPSRMKMVLAFFMLGALGYCGYLYLKLKDEAEEEWAEIKKSAKN